MISERNEFVPLPAQTEFMSLPHNYDIDIACYQGGKGSGKTCCGAVLGITLCEQHAGIQGLCGAVSYPTLEGSLIPEYFNKLEFFGYRYGRHFKYNETKKRLTFDNGSTIFFRYFADPEAFKGIDAGFVQIDEMSQIPESAYEECLARLRQVNTKKGWVIPTRRLFGHTNPASGRGWLYNVFFDKIDYSEKVEYTVDNKPKYYKRFFKKQQILIDDDMVTVPIRAVIAPTTQNIHAKASTIASMKLKYDEEYFNIHVLGENGDYMKGIMCKHFSDHNIRAHIDVDPLRPLHLTCDFNRDPMSWVVAQKTDNEIYFIDEYSIADTHTEAVVKMFIKDYPAHRNPYIIINGDSSGNFRNSISPETHYSLMFTMLTNAGYTVDIKVPAGNVDVEKRIASWNGMVLNTRGERRLFMAEKCEKLRWNCDNLKYKEGSSVLDEPTVTQIQRDPKLKWVGHAFHAASYMCQFYFPIEAVDEDEEFNRQKIILPYNSRYTQKYRMRR